MFFLFSLFFFNINEETLCFQTSKYFYCCLKISHTQDMMMITPAIYLGKIGGEVFFLKNRSS